MKSLKLIFLIVVLCVPMKSSASCDSTKFKYAIKLIESHHYKKGLDILITLDCGIETEFLDSIFRGMSNTDSVRFSLIRHYLKFKDYKKAYEELHKVMNSSETGLDAKEISLNAMDSVKTLWEKELEITDSIALINSLNYFESLEWEKALSELEKVKSEQFKRKAANQRKEIISLSQDLQYSFSKSVRDAVLMFIEYWIPLVLISLYILYKIRNNRKKLILVNESYGLDGYDGRFKTLFLEMYSRFQKTYQKSFITNPLLLNLIPIDIPIIDEKDIDINAALEGIKYAAWIKWLISIVDRPAYRLVYSFRVDGNTNMVFFNSYLAKRNRMVFTYKKKFQSSGWGKNEERILYQIILKTYENLKK